MDDSVWIVNPDEYEDKCIAIRSKTAYIFCYPIVPEVLATGCKVMTRTGQTVKKVQQVQDGYVGILDGEELHWDRAGRYSGPYKDDQRDLFISERFFRKDWQANIKMSNAEYVVRFGRLHPTVKIPRE